VDHKCITPVLGVQPGLTYLKQTVHHWEETNQTDKNLDFVPIGMLKKMSLLLNSKLKHLNTCLTKKKVFYSFDSFHVAMHRILKVLISVRLPCSFSYK